MSSLIEQRRSAVTDALSRARELVAEEGVSRETLEKIAGLIEALAARQELFPTSEFPPPPAGDPNASTHYLLGKEPDDTFALYLNSINPGKKTPPHNHTTWAVIVAIEGDELNKIYERVDQGLEQGRAQLRLAREVTVSPGRAHVSFLGDDIHSIHVVGERSTRHFHLYGTALENMTNRSAFDLEAGTVYNYNNARVKAEHDAR